MKWSSPLILYRAKKYLGYQGVLQQSGMTLAGLYSTYENNGEGINSERRREKGRKRKEMETRGIWTVRIQVRLIETHLYIATLAYNTC